MSGIKDGSGLFTIQRSRLAGRVRVSGAKNSALNALVASLLTPHSLHLRNYPDTLLDAKVLVEMLEVLGKRCEVSRGQIDIYENHQPSSCLDYSGRSIRNTLAILGALTARNGAGSVPLPGGCRLGERKYDLHVKVLECLGLRIWSEKDRLCGETSSRLRGAEIHLPLRSTGATQNAILAGVLALGTTRLYNPHLRPETLDLIALLRKMGARITVHGNESVAIQGVEVLRGASHELIPDSVEALTWLVASIITGGEVEIVDFPHEHLELPLAELRQSGAQFHRCDDRFVVRGGAPVPVSISTGPYPEIGSDMQPLFAVFGAQAEGQTRITDLRFPNRYGYAYELAKMGLQFELDGNALLIHGGRPLTGQEVTALDIRAGISLALAGFVSEGSTQIVDAWQIERGYDRFVEKAQGLSGKIEAVR
jgi:UDP-N-acetylglucosamine 1-carboxyvinyltransferase